MKTGEFESLNSDQAAGTPFVYHTGLLMTDRLHSGEVDVIARSAWLAYEAGEVRLVQRRVTRSACQYIAVPRR